MEEEKRFRIDQREPSVVGILAKHKNMWGSSYP